MAISPFVISPRRFSAATASVRIAVAACVLLGGCDLGPSYKRPALATPPAWRNQTVAAWPSADWWQGFGSAELDGYIAQARAANFDLAAATARIREADAQARIAGAPLLPSVELDGEVTHSRASTPLHGFQTGTVYGPGASASYEIDFWGKNRAALEAAEATASASRYDRETVELTVMSDVATSYFRALELHDRLSVAENNLDSAMTTLRGLREQEDAGVATALDAAQQETTVSTLNAVIPPLRQQLAQTVDALAILIGKPPEAVRSAGDTLNDLNYPTVAPGLPSELLARRPDVAEAEARLISANANIKAARAAFFPSIQLTANGGTESAALSTLFDPSHGIFGLSAGLTQPIFEGGALTGQYQYSKARYDELTADYRKAVISAFGNVEDALAAVQQTDDEVGRDEDAAATARRAYDIAQAQLHAGTITILTVLNTEGALFSAEDALVQAKFSRLQALVELFNALGGGWRQS